MTREVGTATARTPAHELRRFIPVYVCLVATSVLVNYPGRLNTDSIYMLWQGRTISELNDWHSPFATLIYTFLSPAFGSPGGALVAQSLLLLTLPAVWFVRLFETNAGRVQRVVGWIIWVLAASTFIVLAGQILKDVLGLCFLSLAAASFAMRHRARSATGPFADWILVGASLVAFVLERPTGMFALVAGVLAYLTVCVERPARRVEATRAFAFLVLAVAAVLVVPPFLGAQKSHPENTPIVFDLAGISTVLHQDLFAPIFQPDEPRQAPWDCYVPRASDVFFWGKCQEYQTLVDRHQKALAAAWLPALVHHPMAYLEHRAGFARELLFTARSTSLVPVPPDFVSSVDNAAATPARSPPELMNGLKLWTPSVAFVPFGRIAYFVLAQTSASSGKVWILVLLLLPPLALWLKGRSFARELVVLSVFGIANAVAMIFVGPAAEARYLLPTWWCVALEIVALVSTPWVKPAFAVRRPLSLEKSEVRS